MNINKGLAYILIVLPFIVLSGAAILAENKTQEESLSGPHMVHKIEYEKVDRVTVLKTFFKKYNSPLYSSAETFVQVADKYGMDYRLLPAISCMESTCGKFMPSDSYNAWGWGVYGNNVIRFKNFDEGIETVGKGIYEGYISKGLTNPSTMAPVYTPPNSFNWRNGVNFFMNQIDEIHSDIVG